MGARSAIWYSQWSNLKRLFYKQIVFLVLICTEVCCAPRPRRTVEEHTHPLGRRKCHRTPQEVHPLRSLLHHCHWWHPVWHLRQIQKMYFPMKTGVVRSSQILIQSNGKQSHEMHDSWVLCSSVRFAETGRQLYTSILDFWTFILRPVFENGKCELQVLHIFSHNAVNKNPRSIWKVFGSDW